MQNEFVDRLIHDSEIFPVAERFERLQAALGNSFVLDDARDTFYKSTVFSLGSVLVVDMAYNHRTVARTTRSLRADSIDHYRVLMQTSGEARYETGDSREILRAGDVFVTDMARDDRFISDQQGSSMTLWIPREILDEALPQVYDLHGVRIQGAAKLLYMSHIHSLVEASGNLRKSESALLTSATVSLLAAGLLPSGETLDHARPIIQANLLRQACRYIDLHAREAELSPISICKHFKISRSTVYRMFEPFGGVAHYIQERRLALAHEFLSRPNHNRRLGQVADDFAFKSPAHFSRSFREQFGYSPKEVGARQIVLPGSATAAPAPGEGNFVNWLRSMRG